MLIFAFYFAMENQNSTSGVADYYNQFAVKQVKTGLNLRHYYLRKVLKRLISSPINSVLEIGCGIGTFTSLLAKTYPNTSITGIDISSKNIELAGKRLVGKRFSFFTKDITERISDLQQYDLIVLGDVLEHVPIQTYDVVFENLSKFCKPNSFVFINIPHPEIIHYLRNNKPELLQIIDQPVTQDVLLPQFIKNGFEILSLSSYSLTHKSADYMYYLLNYQKSIQQEFVQISTNCVRIRKFKARFL